MKRAFGATVLAVVVASVIPAAAHHSNPLYFDMSTAITLEGEVLRMEWINPHILLFLQTKNEKGELETWIIQGATPSNAIRQMGTAKERIKPGITIAARVFPPRNPLYVNDAKVVLPTHPEDARKSSHIVGAGEIRFSNGDIVALGGGPKF
jgi:hypothetical protein